jgi:hypothetical protein
MEWIDTHWPSWIDIAFSMLGKIKENDIKFKKQNPPRLPCVMSSRFKENYKI